jgi:processive 1,2-diacylglycerol beta-glucosyltransferase
MSRTTIALLHCPAGGGHLAAARALALAAEELGLAAAVVDALDRTPGWFGRSYVEAHLKTTQHAPWAYGFGYQRLNRRHPTLDRVRRSFDRRMGSALLADPRVAHADVVVATHFFPLSVLGGARLRGELAAPLVGVVTDFAAHAFWAEPGVDLFCVAAGGPRLDLGRFGVPAWCIEETGIPVAPAFGKMAEQGLAIASAERPLEVLVTSGGFGVGPLASVVASFAGIPDVRLTIVCGRDERVRRHVARVAQRTAVDACVLGFEANMPARVARSHLLVGKAGGLTTSEALAAGRPMILVGTCPGQERHNEEWLCLNGAAVRATPEAAGACVARLRAGGRLEPMARRAHELGAPRAAERVVEAAARLVPRRAA